MIRVSIREKYSRSIKAIRAIDSIVNYRNYIYKDSLFPFIILNLQFYNWPLFVVNVLFGHIYIEESGYTGNRLISIV